MRIFTHDGNTHADDAFACAALTLIYPDAPVIRTRDVAVLSDALNDSNSIFVDVTGAYNPSRGQFDHHQASGAGYRDPDTRRWPYASAGLIWKHFGVNCVHTLHPELTLAECAQVATYVDNCLIRAIDAVDCGVRLKSAGPTISTIVASFNQPWFEEDGVDQFPLVKALCQEILVNFIKREVGKIKARTIVQESVRLLNGRLLLLDNCLPWTEIVAQKMPDILLVMYPLTKGADDWHIRVAENEDNSNRILMPKAWGGLQHEALAAICGEPTAKFCHRSLHLAGASSYVGALTMAREILKLNAQPDCTIHASEPDTITA